jgi:hypothetical protein
MFAIIKPIVYNLLNYVCSSDTSHTSRVKFIACDVSFEPRVNALSVLSAQYHFQEVLWYQFCELFLILLITCSTTELDHLKLTGIINFVEMANWRWDSLQNTRKITHALHWERTPTFCQRFETILLTMSLASLSCDPRGWRQLFFFQFYIRNC